LNQANILANRFREVILNGTWVANTNFKHQLTGMNWEMAVQPLHGLNTIALLTQHIHYYIKGLNQVFRGGTLDIRDKFSFDFPPVTSQADWDRVVQQLWDDSEAFADLVEQMPDEQLEQPFADPKYGTYRRNIDGMIEHAYYHLGQITLLKKALSGQVEG
jgi:uncharacterized damage-inducible protein DinB